MIYWPNVLNCSWCRSLICGHCNANEPRLAGHSACLPCHCWVVWAFYGGPISLERAWNLYKDTLAQALGLCVVLFFSRVNWLGLFFAYFRSFPDWRLCWNHYLVIREGAMQRGGRPSNGQKGSNYDILWARTYSYSGEFYMPVDNLWHGPTPG